jgi:hypothetical protein
METAYSDAAGRLNPDFTNLGAAGEIGGLILAPGLYKWTTAVSISSDITLSGGANDVWIFQIAGDINEAGNIKVNLSGSAQVKNIFWQVAGGAIIGASAQFKGIILSQTAITLASGASVNGRLLTETAVTLSQNTVAIPAP